MLDRVREKRGEIYKLAGEHKAEKLWVFGSCARKEEVAVQPAPPELPGNLNDFI